MSESLFRPFFLAAFLAAGIAAAGPLPGPAPLAAQEQARDLKAAADSAFDASERERARELYRRALEQAPDDQRVLLRLGMLEGWAGDHEASLGYLDRLLELNPDRSDAQQVRARVLAWSGRRDQAADTLRGFLQNRPDDVRVRETLAQILRWDGRYEEAAGVLEPAVRLEPDDLELRASLAELYLRSEQWEKAEREYETLIEMAGEDRAAPYQIQRAELLQRRGDEQAARALYTELLDRAPAEAHLALGLMQREKGDYVGAEEHFRAAVQADPENREARVQLARVLRWQGRNQSALDELREARELESGAGAADWRWARAMVGPRSSVSYGGAHDSDGNDMLTLRGSFSVPLGPRLQASAGGFWKDNVQETSTFRIAREAVGGDVGLRFKSDRGWSLGAEVGQSSYPDTDLESQTSVGVGVSTPSRHRFAADASFSSEVVDWTAALLREQVRKVEGDASARVRMVGGWDLSAGFSLAEFRGETGDNRRLGGDLVLGFPSPGQFGVALAGKAYGFEHDFTDGYYDPNLYTKVELVARWDEELMDPVEIGLEVSPGYRFSREAPGEDGEWEPTIGGEADVAFVFAPGRRIQFRSSYSRSDPLGSLGAGDVVREDGYEYWSVGLGLGWTF